MPFLSAEAGLWETLSRRRRLVSCAQRGHCAKLLWCEGNRIIKRLNSRYGRSRLFVCPAALLFKNFCHGQLSSSVSSPKKKKKNPSSFFSPPSSSTASVSSALMHRRCCCWFLARWWEGWGGLTDVRRGGFSSSWVVLALQCTASHINWRGIFSKHRPEHPVFPSTSSSSSFSPLILAFLLFLAFPLKTTVSGHDTIILRWRGKIRLGQKLLVQSLISSSAHICSSALLMVDRC